MQTNPAARLGLNGPRVCRISPVEITIAVGYLTVISFCCLKWWRH